MEINSQENQQKEEAPEWLANFMNRQGDWLEKTKGNVMVTATVIAAMTFQIMVNPPGGVWQSDDCSLSNESRNQTADQPAYCKVKAGTSVLQHDSVKSVLYLWMVISSTVSFSASMSIILLVVSGLRLRNRLIMAVFIITMFVAVLCVSAAYLLTVALVQFENENILAVLGICFGFWVVFLVLVLVSQLVQFLKWCCSGQRRRRSA